MFSRTFECPSCGAPVVQSLPGSRSLVCGYCHQTSHILPGGLSAAGPRQLLIDYGSAFSAGMEVRIGGRTGRIMGRIRFGYEDGFWDEWYLRYLDSDEEAWIQEDDGAFVLFRLIRRLDRPVPFGSVRVGTWSDLGGNLQQEVFVTEKNTAQIQGGEGELPFRIVPGEQADFIDAIDAGQLASIEVLPSESLLFAGVPVPFDAFERPATAAS
ncbi:MAG: DUF4178 domain-containing protein [Bacteroidia bacterium]|nr:DUF4178 domain-containing protein [Bacteroidia bacterium]